MSLLHAQSVEATKSELDLFCVPPTQVSIEGGKWVHYKPLSSVQDQSTMEFVVPGRGDEYVDMAHTMLYLQAQITKMDDSVLADDDEVGPVNNWIHSLFSQVDVHLNQKLISPAANTYAYRSYIETLLSYGPAAKQSHLTSALYYQDTNDFNNLTENKGYLERKKFTKNSK